MQFLISVRKDFCIRPYSWQASSSPHFVDALIRIIFAVASHPKYFISSNAIGREKQRLPEMLEDVVEAQTHAANIPTIIITGCS
jgi:hypothetical protein